MYGNSRIVASAQQGIHRQLGAVLAKHQLVPFRKPIAGYSVSAYQNAMSAWDGSAPILLDAGCGVGWSTLTLARLHPDHYVLGVDQSAERLARGKPADIPPNTHFARADLVDFWRLLAADGVHVARHFVLYPNPWPKIGHLGRRWHGHPVFPSLLALGGILECRSNWYLYVAELAFALQFVTGLSAPVEEWPAVHPLTPFERKYRDSGQCLYRLVLDLDQA